MKHKNAEAWLNHSYKICENCFYVHDQNSYEPTVRITKSNDDGELYVLNKVAAEIFLSLLTNKKLGLIINDLETGYAQKDKNLLLNLSLNLVEELVTKKILVKI